MSWQPSAEMACLNMLFSCSVKGATDTNLGLGITTGSSVLIFKHLKGRDPDSETGSETDTITIYEYFAVVMDNATGFKSNLGWSVFQLYEHNALQA